MEQNCEPILGHFRNAQWHVGTTSIIYISQKWLEISELGHFEDFFKLVTLNNLFIDHFPSRHFELSKQGKHVTLIELMVVALYSGELVPRLRYCACSLTVCLNGTLYFFFSKMASELDNLAP